MNTGYHPIRHAVSDYAIGPTPQLFTAALITSSAAVLGLSFVLIDGIGSPPLPVRALLFLVTTLFAALEIATGLVIDRCFQQHTNKEFLTFIKQVAKAYPRVQLHVVCDNYANHKPPNIQAWLAKHPRVHLHFTPTCGSWLNMVSVNRPWTSGLAQVV